MKKFLMFLLILCTFVTPVLADELEVEEITEGSQGYSLYSDVQMNRPVIEYNEESDTYIVNGKEVGLHLDDEIGDYKSHTDLGGISVQPEDLIGVPIKKEYGLKDVLTITALILTVSTVVVLWVLHSIRERQDPLNRWKM